MAARVQDRAEAVRCIPRRMLHVIDDVVVAVAVVGLGDWIREERFERRFEGVLEMEIDCVVVVVWRPWRSWHTRMDPTLRRCCL